MELEPALQQAAEGQGGRQCPSSSASELPRPRLSCLACAIALPQANLFVQRVWVGALQRPGSRNALALGSALLGLGSLDEISGGKG